MTQEVIKNLQELQAFATRIYNLGKRIICLKGDLGAGKTEFARNFINNFSDLSLKVTSPTYNIVQIYELGGKKIYHFDLYRIENAEELREIGLEEALENDICLIEWPEIAEFFLKSYKNEIINLKIEIIDENSRKISIN